MRQMRITSEFNLRWIALLVVGAGLSCAYYGVLIWLGLRLIQGAVTSLAF